MNAAMKMLPPSAVATPAASSADAAVRICVQCGSIRRRRAAKRRASAAEHAGGDAADEPVADLLEHQLDGGVVGDRAGLGLGERDRDEEQRHAEAVVEAALDVEPLADPRRDPLVGDDRLAERGVRAREHDGEHERLGEVIARHDRDAGERPGERS